MDSSEVDYAAKVVSFTAMILARAGLVEMHLNQHELKLTKATMLHELFTAITYFRSAVGEGSMPARF